MSEQYKKNQTMGEKIEVIENEKINTPIKLVKIVKIEGGGYGFAPVNIEEAIAKSARRVKVLPNGKVVRMPTSIEDRIMRLTKTDYKPPKIDYSAFRPSQNVDENDEIIFEKRKVVGEPKTSRKLRF
ncbi:hypothetical protein SteCoe_27892 [Stentor coeruleus]|uniref:Uncharacterized protein n=1 Tax=Stentor coeruleus TaxID=5963 RepID=A0A1R2B9G3_9CILI|nr:hypothetical protein SteCoe_27892 [Stentor coeruleus]